MRYWIGKRVGGSRQVAEQAEALAQAEARRQHRLAREAAVCHTADADHVAGVQGGVAKRAEGEEGYWRSENDHAEDDCLAKSARS